jgi:Secretion system C-terminal sorting domain
MKRWGLIIFLSSFSLSGFAQTFELLDKQESFQTSISETLRIPLKIRNNTTKAQFYIIRKLNSDLTSTQKGYFCLEKTCLEPGIEEFSKKVEPGETLQTLAYVLESGIQSGQGTIKFQVFAKGSPTDALDYAVSVSVLEKNQKPIIFQSKDITIQDVYPNPVQDLAYMDYRIHNESITAKVVIHNILGKAISEFELSAFEDRAKIQTDEFVSGIYFYTLYLNNNGVLTRKLIIRK